MKHTNTTKIKKISDKWRVAYQYEKNNNNNNHKTSLNNAKQNLNNQHFECKLNFYKPLTIWFDF